MLKLTDYLKGFATEERWNTITEVANKRTQHITVVIEDIYQPHNASAVLRSCDGFGIQDVHIIENNNEFDASSQVTIGADQWLSIHRYNNEGINNTTRCLESLREQGYQIIATSPHENDTELNDLNIDQKTALVFGTELDGISDTVKENADGYVKIPMAGFSESFNISVSAAICLYDLTLRMRRSTLNWQLSDEELDLLKYEWLKRSIKAGEKLEKQWLENNLDK
ncbi:TrmH family RNA methyltransferase [Gracilimonas sp. Q87]|uniref:TrmH family RNA methyltransferase n=1 Tax=Gracilimonas sp. Q87 TaxID=3384766 RepID=UPI0039840271